jgi:hypothetical protein
MLVDISGTRDGAEWPRRGGLIDVPDHEAADLIANKFAEAATDEPVVETASVEPVAETAAKKPGRPRKTAE